MNRGGAAWDVVVVGGANTDYLIHSPRLPAPGETVQGDAFQEAAGGKGANQAVAAARLGARVAFVGCLGADERAKELKRRVEAEAVDTRCVVERAGEPTGVALIVVGDGGEKSIAAYLGANRRLSIDDVRRAAEPLRSTAVVLLQLEVPLETVEEAARIGAESGAKVVLDPAPARPLPDDLLRRLTLVRPNSGEARVLTGIEVRDRASAREAAEQLRRRGAAAAAVQAGQEGDLLVWAEGEAWLPRLAVKSVDATGAGDAFAAAMAVALAEGRPWPEAGRFASAAAALKTTRLGAQAGLPRRSEVDALLAGTFPVRGR
ncbi:MAG TPA: ribokinase [Vicinamibacteria bacterium]|nr:ribokinase [Vicinamibacteria bacterium]